MINPRFSPIAILRSQLQIETFEFNPSNPDLLIAGCSNGQISLFSLKKLNTLYFQSKKSLSKLKDQNQIIHIDNILISSILESFNAHQTVTNTEAYSRKSIYLNSHRGPVKAIRFLSKYLELDRKNPLNIIKYDEGNDGSFGNQFMSLGIDGQILFWDLRFDHLKDKKNEMITNKGIYII